MELRMKLKSDLLEESGYKCVITGNGNILDMHEWLVKRSDLPIKRLQGKIFHPFNCIIVSREFHDSDGILRDWKCAEWALKKYGWKEIEEWLNSLNLRTFGSLTQWINKKEDSLKVEKSLLEYSNLSEMKTKQELAEQELSHTV